MLLLIADLSYSQIERHLQCGLKWGDGNNCYIKNPSVNDSTSYHWKWKVFCSWTWVGINPRRIPLDCFLPTLSKNHYLFMRLFSNLLHMQKDYEWPAPRTESHQLRDFRSMLWSYSHSYINSLLSMQFQPWSIYLFWNEPSPLSCVADLHPIITKLLEFHR